MTAMLTMARLHLLQTFQSTGQLIQYFVVPVILMVILGVAVNEDSAVAGDIAVDISDQDQSVLSAELVSILRANQVDDTVANFVFCVYGSDDLDEACGLAQSTEFDAVSADRILEGDAVAALIIPEGFEAALLAGESLELDYRNNAELNLPTAVQAQIESALGQLASSVAVARVGIDSVETNFGGFADDDTQTAAFDQLLSDTQTQLQNPPVILETESSGEEVVIGIGARQSVPGQGSMFVLFSLLSISAFMVQEREQGTLKRLLTVPTARVNIVLGKILGAFFFGVLQFALYIVLGFFIGIDWGNDYAALVALVVTFCLAGTALGFLLSTLVKTTAQASTMITLIGLTLAPLGGAWWPLSIVPEFMQTIGHISPIAWVMDGFQDILYFNGTLADVALECAVLLGYAVVLTAIGVYNFRYED